MSEVEHDKDDDLVEENNMLEMSDEDIMNFDPSTLVVQAPVVEEDSKKRLSEKILTLKDLFREFLLAWISKLKEDGFIQNEYFAYDFAGLHRDGSFVFRRQKSID